MKKKHIIRNVILILLLAVAAALIANVLIARATTQRQATKTNDQISLGVHYLDEMDFEAAVAAFETALSIDEKNVTAYIGLALASEGKEGLEQAITVLEEGFAITEDEALEVMISDARQGKSLLDTYHVVDYTKTSEGDRCEEVQIGVSPYKALRILGSNYYEWNIVACAELFHFDYEQYKGQRVDLGYYQGFHITFDNRGQNIELVIADENCTYSYRFHENSQMQFFKIRGDAAKGELRVLKEIICFSDCSGVRSCT